MKKLRFIIIVLSVFFCLLIPNLFADERKWLPVDGNLTDITGDDPYYYTSDQAVTDHDGQKLLVGQGRPKTTHSSIPHLPVYSGNVQGGSISNMDDIPKGDLCGIQ